MVISEEELSFRNDSPIGRKLVLMVSCETIF